VKSNLNNNNTASALNVLRKIRPHISFERKKQLTKVSILSLFASISESISIAALIPFISFFINPESYLFNSFFKTIFNFLNIDKKDEILGFVSALFIFAVITSAYLKLKYIKITNLVTENITSDFRIKIFNFLINQNYNYYFTHGSKEVLSNLSQKTSSFSTIIFAAINVLNSILISLAIVSVLIFNEPLYTPIIISIIVLFFFIIFKVKANSILKKGQRVNVNQNFLIDIFENTVGYLPEVFVYNLKKFYSSILIKISKETAQSGAEIRSIAMFPKIYLETFIIVFVVAFIYLSGFSNRSTEINISYIAILAFAAQKIIPLINGVYIMLVNSKGITPTILSFLNILEQNKKEIIEDEKYENLKFDKTIILEKISFQYEENLPKILDETTIKINKGEKVVIKGETGSGKSTLMNIISGLLIPSSGRFLIDDVEINESNIKNWQKNISIVPQSIFLNDSTILENIAVAVNLNEIDFSRAKKSAQIAQIDTFIENLPDKYNEKVGERGVRLSGGQRQRIGIARALYRNTSLIILDEPTNALDFATEKLVLESIIKLRKDITVIMISHSNESIKYFNKIVDLNNKK